MPVAIWVYLRHGRKWQQSHGRYTTTTTREAYAALARQSAHKTIKRLRMPFVADLSFACECPLGILSDRLSEEFALTLRPAKVTDGAEKRSMTGECCTFIQLTLQ